MWYIAEWRWWRAKRLLNDAHDNNAVLRMGIDDDGRNLNKNNIKRLILAEKSDIQET